MRLRKLELSMVCISALFSIQLIAADKTLKASIAKMPVYAESKDKGILVDFVKDIQTASGLKIEYDVVPFARSMNSVVTKAVDFHLPLIKLPKTDKGTDKFDYSTETIFHVNFTLYTNKSKSVDKNNLKNLTIETDAAHIEYFDFPIIASNSIEGSMKKVDAGKIDGFIFADTASDPFIKQDNLKNIKRELYQRFDVKIILPKGGNGGEVDKILSAAIAKLRKEGKFDKLMGPIDAAFSEKI